MIVDSDEAVPVSCRYSLSNLKNSRTFYLQMGQTLSGQLPPGTEPKIGQTVSGELPPTLARRAFLLPWSHYVRLLAVKNEPARHFYEVEALRGGWSVRQLRQLNHHMPAPSVFSVASCSKDRAQYSRATLNV